MSNPEIHPSNETPLDLTDSVRGEGKIIVDSLTSEEINKWWPIYDAPFRQMNEENPCRQSFNKDEFEEAMKSETMAKLAYVENGEIVSMALLSNDFGHFPWLSERYFQKKYPEEYGAGRIHYFISFLTDPNSQKQGYGEKVLEFVTELFSMEDKEQIITFDCCDANSTWMPDMIAAIPRSTGLGSLEFEELGQQHYFAGKLLLNKVAQEA